MEATYVPLISALVGAVIGSLSSIGIILIQSHFQNKREITKHAIELPLEDFKIRLEHIKEVGGRALPLAVFIHYHINLMRLATKDELTPEALEHLSARQEELIQAIAKISKLK